jgi:hypothetical protein
VCLSVANRQALFFRLRSKESVCYWQPGSPAVKLRFIPASPTKAGLPFLGASILRRRVERMMAGSNEGNQRQAIMPIQDTTHKWHCRDKTRGKLRSRLETVVTVSQPVAQLFSGLHPLIDSGLFVS